MRPDVGIVAKYIYDADYGFGILSDYYLELSSSSRTDWGLSIRQIVPRTGFELLGFPIDEY